MNNCITCIRDTTTGECYDIKDKIARQSIEELKNTINSLTGVEGNLATDEELQALKTTIDSDIETLRTNTSENLETLRTTIDENMETIQQELDNLSGGFLYKPNLIINPNFKINQRGQTNYNYTHGMCTVDRWLFKGSSVSVTVNSDNLAMVSTHTASLVYQVLENPMQYNGKTLQLTATSSGSGTRYIGLAMVIDAMGSMSYLESIMDSTTSKSTKSITYKIGNALIKEGYKLVVYIRNNTTNVTNKFYNVTLTEIDPNDTTPVKAIERSLKEEEELCKQHYVKYPSNIHLHGINVTTNASRAYLQLPYKMPRTPVINLGSLGNITYQGNAHAISEFTIYDMIENQISFSAFTNDTISYGYTNVTSIGTTLELDAEDYI